MEYGKKDSISCVINGNTEFCFLIGSSISHSLSPEMQTQWFQKNNINCIYLPLQIEVERDFHGVLEKLLILPGFRGANITLPFKKTILQNNFLKKSDSVLATQAANTLYKDSLNYWCLENTDIFGIQKSILSLYSNEDVSFDAIVLGGGGSAASIFYCLENNLKCKKNLVPDSQSRKTKQQFSYLTFKEKIDFIGLDCDTLENLIETNDSKNILLINTLPLGLQDQNLQNSYSQENIYAKKILNYKQTEKRIKYFDLVYKDTDAVNLAKENSIENINGKLMLVTQAQESFKLWTGVTLGVE